MLGTALADDLADIKQHGSIRIGVKDSSPPFSQYDPATKTVTGYDIEFAMGIAKRLGVKPVLHTIESSDRIPMLNNKTIDIIVADFSKTPERTKQVDFSVGYYIAEERVLGKIGRFKAEEDMKGAVVGITNGSSLATGMPKDFPDTKLVLVSDKPDLVKQLNAGLVDGIASSTPVLNSLISQLQPTNAYELSSFPLYVKASAVGIRLGQKNLVNAVNDALIDMEKSGEAVRIYERWFGANSKNPMPRIFKIQP